MKVLVTGATGFLGKAIVDELLQNEFEVYTTGKTLRQEDLPNYLPADLTVSESFPELEKIGEIGAIIHSAGLAHQFGETSAEKFLQVNAEGTRKAANLAVRLKAEKFILISSVAVYGEALEGKSPGDGFEENLQCQPIGFYAESKLEAERIAAEICGKSRIDLTILRPSTIIGEGDRGNLARLIEAVDRRRFVWIGGGKNSKSLVYKTDVARACLHFLGDSGKTKKDKPEVYNVTAAPVPMREIVRQIEKVLGRSVPPLRLPGRLLQKSLNIIGRASRVKKLLRIAGTLDKWLSDDVFSGEKIHLETGFQTRVNPIEGIRRETVHYRRNQK